MMRTTCALCSSSPYDPPRDVIPTAGWMYDVSLLKRHPKCQPSKDLTNEMTCICSRRLHTGCCSKAGSLLDHVLTTPVVVALPPIGPYLVKLELQLSLPLLQALDIRIATAEAEHHGCWEQQRATTFVVCTPRAVAGVGHLQTHKSDASNSSAR